MQVETHQTVIRTVVTLKHVWRETMSGRTPRQRGGEVGPSVDRIGQGSSALERFVVLR